MVGCAQLEILILHPICLAPFLFHVIFFFTKRSKTFWLRPPTSRLCITLGQLLATQIPGALWPSGSWSHIWKVHSRPRHWDENARDFVGLRWEMICGLCRQWDTLWDTSLCELPGLQPGSLYCAASVPLVCDDVTVRATVLYQSKRSSVARL